MTTSTLIGARTGGVGASGSVHTAPRFAAGVPGPWWVFDTVGVPAEPRCTCIAAVALRLAKSGGAGTLVVWSAVPMAAKAVTLRARTRTLWVGRAAAAAPPKSLLERQQQQ
jgi:hypothetical protein